MWGTTTGAAAATTGGESDDEIRIALDVYCPTHASQYGQNAKSPAGPLAPATPATARPTMKRSTLPGEK
eukprot:5129648-Pyramimonas_sp.AAC.1